jgi:hypothetical protein
MPWADPLPASADGRIRTSPQVRHSFSVPEAGNALARPDALGEVMRNVMELSDLDHKDGGRDDEGSGGRGDGCGRK